MWTPVIVGTAITLVAVPGYFVAQSALGLRGVALASVLSLGAYTAALAGIWYRAGDARAGGRRVLEDAGRAIPLAVPASLAAGGISWAIWSQMTSTPTLAAVVALAVGVAVYAGVALGIGSLLYDWLTTRSRKHSGTHGDDPEVDPDPTPVHDTPDNEVDDTRVQGAAAPRT